MESGGRDVTHYEQAQAMKSGALIVALALAAAVLAVGPFPGQIRNLVTFGDSYTDVVRSRLPQLMLLPAC